MAVQGSVLASCKSVQLYEQNNLKQRIAKIYIGSPTASFLIDFDKKNNQSIKWICGKLMFKLLQWKVRGSDVMPVMDPGKRS